MEILIESGRHVGRELDALRVAWACVGVGEPDWAALEGLLRLSDSTMSSLGRQPWGHTVDNGTLTSVAGLYLISRQVGVSRAVMLGEQEPEQTGTGFLTSWFAGFRIYPVKVEQLDAEDRMRLQVILLTGLQRAAYHLRALLLFRAIFHPTFTAPKDGISSYTIWDEGYYRRFCECWGTRPDFEDLQWLVLSHAITHIKQRWEEFACAAAHDLAGVAVTDSAFPQQMLRRILAGRSHLVTDRSERIIRLLNWIGQPAVAKRFTDLLLAALQRADFEVSPHTLFRVVLLLGEFGELPADFSNIFLQRMTSLFAVDSSGLQRLAESLDSTTETECRGVYFLTQCMLCCGRISSLDSADRRHFAERLERHLERLAENWHLTGGGTTKAVSGIFQASLPDRRFEWRWWVELADVYRLCGEYDRGRSWSVLQRLGPFFDSESGAKELMAKLRESCLEDEDPAAGILKWYSLAEILISVAAQHSDHSGFSKGIILAISADEVPLQRGEVGSIQQQKIAALKRMLPPAQFVRYLDMCLQGWPGDSKEFGELCDSAVHEVIRIAYEEICPGTDRLEFIRSLKRFRASVLEMSLATQTSGGDGIPPLALSEWMELLDHRLLIEQYLCGERRDEGPAVAAVPAGAWGATEKWQQAPMPELAETLNSWQTSWRAIAAADTDNRVPLASGVPQSLSISIESEDDTKEWQNDCSTQGRTIRNASDVPSELRAVIGFRARLNQYLQDGAIWVKTLFDQHGRLRWWAFRLQRETAELELVASGRSGRGAARRIQLECAILDAQIEASYNLLSIDADDWREGWEKIDPGAVLRRALPEKLNTASATEWQRTLTAAREAVRRLREGIARGTGNMPDVSFPKLLCVAHLAETFCNAIDNARSSGIERELIGWQETVNTIDRGWTGLEGANPDEILQAFDRLLNNACDAHLEGISRELSLESLNRCLNQDTDLLVTLDGPLSSAPIEYLRIAGVPLHQRVQSITSVLSTSLAVVQPTAHRAPAGTDSDNAMFTAIWQSKDSRSADRYDGLYILHAGLHQLCKQQSPGAAGNWSCRSAVDSPPADNATIQSTLAADIFPIIVIGGHGLLGSRQRHGPSRKSGIEVAPAIRSKAKKDLWHGNGDLRGNQAMILCACMVGRLCDDEDDGIRGLFTEALVAGGRVFIGARWTVHACYSALFCLRLTERLMQSLREHGTIKENRPFLVSRIINQVRREMLQEMPRAMHSISAFTCFGLSEHRN